MGLREVLRESVLTDEIAGLFGIDLWRDEWESGNRRALRAESERKLELARLFLPINILSGYSFLGPPKSQLYSREEIAEILLRHGYAHDRIEAQQRTDELIEQGCINFFWASRGVSDVKIVLYRNDQGDARYRFEANFCDDGL